MRRVMVPAAAALALACGGRTPAPGTTPAPSAARSSAGGDPTTLRYAPGSVRYRIEGASAVSQAVMGNTQTYDLATSMLLSTTLGEEAGAIALAMTVESLSVTGSVPGIDAGVLGAARGRTFRALFTPAGRVISVASPDTASAALAELARRFREFLPTLPASPIAAGSAWSDTVTQELQLGSGVGSMTTQAVREHRVVGWETHDGVRALHLVTAGRSTITGHGEVQGQPIELTGGGAAAADQYVSAAGVFLGGSATDSTDITVNMTSMGISVPVRQTQRSTITRLP